MSRTLSGINEENSIDIPSTPNSIRIGGKLGERGFLVGVNNTTGNIDFVLGYGLINLEVINSKNLGF